MHWPLVAGGRWVFIFNVLMLISYLVLQEIQAVDLGLFILMMNHNYLILKSNFGSCFSVKILLFSGALDILIINNSGL